MSTKTGTRTSRAALGYSADLIGSSMITVLQFFLVPFYLDLTSGSLYGYWLMLLSIVGWIALTDMGLGIALLRLVAGIDDDDELSNLFSTAFMLFLGIALMVVIAGVMASQFLAQWFGIAQDDIAVVNETFLVLLIASAIALPLSLFSEMLNGFQKMALVHTITLASALAGIALTVAMMLAGAGLVSLAYGQLLTVIVRSLASFVALKMTRRDVRLSPGLFRKNDCIRLVSFGGYFQVGKVAHVVQTTMDNIIIAAFLSSAMVSTYVFTSKLAVLVSQTIAGKLPIAAMPGMSQLFAQGDLSTLRDVFIRLSGYSTRLATFTAFYLWLLNEQFVATWVGSEYYGGLLLSLTFVYWVFQDSIYRGVSGVLYASGRIRGWTMMSVIEAVLNLAISLSLVGRLGLLGVALGTAISKTVTTAWYTPYLICKQVELSGFTYCYRGLLSPLLFSLPSCLAMYLTWYVLADMSGWIPLIVIGVVGGIANVLVFEYSKIYQFASRLVYGFNH